MLDVSMRERDEGYTEDSEVLDSAILTLNLLTRLCFHIQVLKFSLTVVLNWEPLWTIVGYCPTGCMSATCWRSPNLYIA